jgi:hypothetical protein
MIQLSTGTTRTEVSMGASAEAAEATVATLGEEEGGRGGGNKKSAQQV